MSAPFWAVLVLLLQRVGAFMGIGTYFLVVKAMDWAGTKRTWLSLITAGLLCFPGIILTAYLTFLWQAWRLGVALSPSTLEKLIHITLSRELLWLSLFLAGAGVVVAVFQIWNAQRRNLARQFQPRVEYIPGMSR